MDMIALQMMAGTASSMIYIGANLTMLVKIWRTRDMQSFSLTMILINNIGNLVYWLYVLSLQFGPIWFAHGFFSCSGLFMLISFLRYHKSSQPRTRRTFKRISQTIDILNFKVF